MNLIFTITYLIGISLLIYGIQLAYKNGQKEFKLWQDEKKKPETGTPRFQQEFKPYTKLRKKGIRIIVASLIIMFVSMIINFFI